ncbi:hypothetical protein [Flagellimonas algicola]|uniref:Fibronectin type-III domain-containing protein n=1 Tax=Flagellimonas algicola TaxID=2583815 RepID=A0ABY2WJC4_9FLAO|nr:hypothetical protein [Allomuricauda algicola]TMU54695.1 hypothetical protein FGG15_10855 [Allomuricauda algicola]
MKQFLAILGVFVLLYSCSKSDDGPPAPEGANLVFPNENSECTTGVSINNALSQVTFEWSASANTDTYTLSVVNLDTNIPQTISTAATSASLSIEKGTPFSWSVTSRNSNTDQTATSDTWLFYNAGSQTNYAPFPAQVVSPVSGSTIQKSVSNEVTLEWTGSDVEDDIESFEVFFSDQNPPATSLGVLDPGTNTIDVGVLSDTVYYWRITTTDVQGNTSDSGIFDFRVF